jgi:hypothetical protein
VCVVIGTLHERGSVTAAAVGLLLGILNAAWRGSRRDSTAWRCCCTACSARSGSMWDEVHVVSAAYLLVH